MKEKSYFLYNFRVNFFTQFIKMNTHDWWNVFLAIIEKGNSKTNNPKKLFTEFF